MELPALDLKCVQTGKNTKGKSNNRFFTDIEARRHGYRMGLETPVVHAVNDGFLMFK